MTELAIDEQIRLTYRCEQFVLGEADLLDRRQLAAWTELFAPDALYWLPMDPTQVDPGDGLNLIFDDRARLLDRVSRLQSGLAFSDEPHSATSHVLSGVRHLDDRSAEGMIGRSPSPGEHVVVARCVLGRSRRLQVTTFHARVTWILRERADSFLIAMKRVDLLDAGDPQPVLAFLI
ncbi:MAG: antB [Pseudonocardiales bacterium]|nr:antB [Pseudonocardiales bacterium]